MASVTSSIRPRRLSAVLSRSRPRYESGGNSRFVSSGVLTYLVNPRGQWDAQSSCSTRPGSNTHPGQTALTRMFMCP